MKIIKIATESHAPGFMAILNSDEIEILKRQLKQIEKSAASIKKKVDYYTGIHESGKASRKQEVCRFEYEKKLATISNFIKQIKLCGQQ